MGTSALLRIFRYRTHQKHLEMKSEHSFSVLFFLKGSKEDPSIGYIFCRVTVDGRRTVAVSLRELSLGVIKPFELVRVLWQEASVGLINGLVLGTLIGLAAWIWKGNIYLGLVVGGALGINTLIAVSLGGAIPLILKRFNVDPALASGPLLTTITDMLGFFLALTFASSLMSHL